MNTFDILAGMLLLVSALNGLWKGAAHEVVRVISFLIAAILAVYCLRFTGPMFRAAMDPAWLATVAAVLAVFLLIYVALRLLGSSLSRRVQADSTLSALDRGVGFGFGLLRALAVLGLFNILLTAAAPPERQPAWVTGGALYPLTVVSGKVLTVFAPKAGALGGKLNAAARERAASDGNEGYSDGERRRLDDLVESTR